MESTLQNVTKRLGIGLAALCAVSCAKPREAKLSVGKESRVLSIQSLGGNNLGSPVAEIQLTSEKAKGMFTDSPEFALNEKSSYFIRDQFSTKNSEINYMFDSLAVEGEPGQRYPVVFIADSEYLTAYKVVEKAQTLSTLECQLGYKKEQLEISLSMQLGRSIEHPLKTFQNNQLHCDGTTQEVAYVPLFKFKVQAKGTLERKKNSMDEETAELVISPTDLKEATHIQVGSSSDSRKSAPFVNIDSEDEVSNLKVVKGQESMIGVQHVRFANSMDRSGKLSEQAKLIKVAPGSSKLVLMTEENSEKSMGQIPLPTPIPTPIVTPSPSPTVPAKPVVPAPVSPVETKPENSDSNNSSATAPIAEVKQTDASERSSTTSGPDAGSSNTIVLPPPSEDQKAAEDRPKTPTSSDKDQK